MSVKAPAIEKAPPIVIDSRNEAVSERQMLPAGDLRIDYDYQRPPSEKRVRKIAANFDTEALGVIYVNQREDGSYWIIDGQRRTLATLRIRGRDYRLKCEVYHVTLAKEKALFHRFNAMREVMKAGYEARASFGAGDKDMVEIVKALDDLGITHRWVGSVGKEAIICCWGTLRNVYARYGLAHLRITLRTLVTAWPNDGRAIQGMFIGAAARFMALHRDETTIAKVAEKWGRTTTASIYQSADTLSRLRRQFVELALYRELVEAYNFNTRTGHRLQPKA